MRTFTTTCLAFLLLAALVSARLGDSTNTTPTVPTPLDADVSDFLSGVWDSIGLGRDYDDFVTCIEGDSNAATQLQKAMTLMNSSSASDVTKGLNKLDKVASSLVDALKACNMKDKYTSTINKIINKFTSPSKLSVQTGSSILVNGVEVYTEVSNAVIAYDAGNFDSCGTFIGAAMGKAFYGQDNVTDADQAKKLNALPNMTWTAGNTSAFDGLNLWTFKKAHVNLRRKKVAKTNSTDNSTDTTEEADESRRNLAVTTIPAAFDSRTQWAKCIQPIRDQQACGSCWAFAASEVISDRFCIASNGSINKPLSPQYVMSCNTYGMGCNGGYLDLAWKFLESTGDVSDTCLPYKSGNGFVPACSKFQACADGTAIRKYYAKVNSTKMISGISAIQTEIQKYGPVETAFDVYSDFPYYKSGIYTNTASATYLGGHAVKIVGWGNTGGVNYWIVANSWGVTWGDAGYFKIKFGSCGIDGMVIAGTPDLTRS